jgi:hypothetical protein
MKIAFTATALLTALLGVGIAQASSVSEREYKRGYADCLRGDYDQFQHGASYKRGCRAAENSGKSTGHTVKQNADANLMRAVCHGAVIARFHHFTSSVKINQVAHTQGLWQVYGVAVLDDGSTSDFVCMFSSTGRFMRLENSQPYGGYAEVDHDGYCPPDVSEADRYKYPGCN